MSLTVRNGSLVLRNGALGTTQACCCGGCSGPCDEGNPCPEGCECVAGQCVAEKGCCCVDGTPDSSKSTQAACASAGGTWHPGESCKAFDCRCCSQLKVVCHERVWGTYTATYDPPASICTPDAVNDSASGTVLIDAAGLVTCGTAGPEQYCTNDIANRCDDDEVEVGQAVTLTQYYDRWRVVGSCAECMDDGGAFCTPGVSLTACYPLVGGSIFCDCGTVEMCANPLP